MFICTAEGPFCWKDEKVFALSCPELADSLYLAVAGAWAAGACWLSKGAPNPEPKSFAAPNPKFPNWRSRPTPSADEAPGCCAL